MLPMSTRPLTLDREALRAGASVTLLFALPPTLVARFVLDNNDDTSGWAPLLSLIAVLGFVLGSGVAAWRQQSRRPMTHAVVAGAGIFVVAQAVFLAVRIATGGDARVMRILTSFSLSLVASVIGGLLGNFMQKNGVRPR
jgi:NADH:ubiquinone oxidoreductase subunit 2 (subunit N)